MPQGPAARVKEGALLVVVVTVVGVEVAGNDVLEVSVLPVQVTGLDGPCEHSPVGAHLCSEGEAEEEEVRRRCERIQLDHITQKKTHTRGR